MGHTLAIVGTRVLACPGDRDLARVRAGIAIARLRPERVMSGGAKGVDRIAEATARELGYAEAAGTLVVYRAVVHRFHGPGGYRERDERIAEECTHLLRLACRQATTYGSGWTANYAETLGKAVVRDIICPT